MNIPKFNKFYVETQIVPVSRLWEAEMPVGDPFGDQAYGQKNKKLVKSVVKVVKKAAPVVLAAGATIATGGAFAAAAAGGGLAAFSSGLAFAGSALSLVGTVTGNEKLTKIGGIAGLAGGAGMFASNFAQSGAQTLGARFSDAAKETLRQFRDGSAEGWARLTGGTSAAVPDVGGITSGGTPSLGDNGLSALPQGVSDAANFAQAPAEAARTGLSALPKGVSANADLLARPGATAQEYLKMTQTPPPQGGGLINKVLQGGSNAAGYLKDNPMLAIAGGQILSSLYTSPLEEVQAKILEERLGENRRLNESIRPQWQGVDPGLILGNRRVM